MDPAAIEHIRQKVQDEVTKRFPGAPVQRTEVLQYGDDPVIEPGELLVRVTIEAPEGREGQEQALHDFQQAHSTAIREFRHDLLARLPEAGRLEFLVSGGDEHGPRMMLRGRDRDSLEDPALAGGELTPVMARLGPADLETLDALITAGIAGSRAQAVRWALARIRDRPAYAQLQERAREIERLKTEF
jgi:hypothetical protein